MDAPIELKATLESKVSKTGKKYKCIVIKLTNDYEKTVFLEKAEELLVQVTSNNVENTTNPFELN